MIIMHWVGMNYTYELLNLLSDLIVYMIIHSTLGSSMHIAGDVSGHSSTLPFNNCVEEIGKHCLQLPFS